MTEFTLEILIFDVLMWEKIILLPQKVLHMRIHTARSITLSFSQAFLFVFDDGRHQIVDEPSSSGLDLGGDRHARSQSDRGAVDQHGRAVERDACGIGRLVRVRIGAGRGLSRLLALLPLRLVGARDHVLGEARDRAGDGAIAGEGEGIDLH